jgi:2-amino-4-hydroxy-6-hydroxymethyldihydropteridine diphosphokinase
VKFRLIFLGLGSNKGRRQSYLKKAVKSISSMKDFDLFRISPVYETDPWGYTKQRKFLNCVVSGFYWGNHTRLFRDIKKIEKMLGRTKAPRWHSREIDIDILFFGNEIIKSFGIEIPHPGIKQRNFVLYPLNDIASSFVHPVSKKKISYLKDNSKDRSKVKLFQAKLI